MGFKIGCPRHNSDDSTLGIVLQLVLQYQRVRITIGIGIGIGIAYMLSGQMTLVLELFTQAL